MRSNRGTEEGKIEGREKKTKSVRNIEQMNNKTGEQVTKEQGTEEGRIEGRGKKNEKRKEY